MENILILVEKPSHEEIFKKAVPGAACMSIGGHAYTKEDEKFLRVNSEDLEEAPVVCYNDENNVAETVSILDSDFVKRNCIKILDFLHHHKIGTIVNACEPDKSGNYLFKYATEDVMQLDVSKYCFKRMLCYDLRPESIAEVYQQITEVSGFEDVER